MKLQQWREATVELGCTRARAERASEGKRERVAREGGEWRLDKRCYLRWLGKAGVWPPRGAPGLASVGH